MNQIQAVTSKLDLLSKCCAVLMIFMLPFSTSMTDILFIATALLALGSGNYKEKWQLIVQHRIALLFLALFVLFIIGLTYTSAPITMGLSKVNKFSRLLLAVFLLPIFAEQRWRGYAINAFIAATLILLFLSYVKYFNLIHIIPFSQKYTNAAVFKSHIQVSFLLSITSYLFMDRVFSASKYRPVSIIVLALLIYNILFLSMGRSGYVTFSLLTILFLWQKFAWKGLIGGGIVVLILAALAFNFSQVFHTRTDHLDSSNQQRITFWENSLKIIKKHPVFGAGTGSLYHEYSQLKPTPQKITSNPHNEYLNVTVQLGVPGLLILLMLFFFHWKDSFKLPTDMQHLAQAIVVTIAIGCMFNSWLTDTTEGNMYVYFTALTFASLAA